MAKDTAIKLRIKRKWEVNLFLKSNFFNKKCCHSEIIINLLFFFCSEAGILIFPPNFAEHSAEKYEGHWEDGKMSGYGKMRWDFICHLIFTPAHCFSTHHQVKWSDKWPNFYCSIAHLWNLMVTFCITCIIHADTQLYQRPSSYNIHMDTKKRTLHRDSKQQSPQITAIFHATNGYAFPVKVEVSLTMILILFSENCAKVPFV